RALAAELVDREYRALRASQDRERAIAENLAQRLEELRRDESQRPYFHYQNLYHDPKGVSEGLSIVPSPLATGSTNPLVAAYFQVEPKGRVTLPTLNEEVRELNAPNAAEQVVIRDSLTRASTEMRAAALPLVAALASDDARTRETDARIAELEALLAASQRAAAAAAARRAPSAKPPPPQVAAVKQAPEVKKEAPSKVQALSQQSQMLDSSAFAQNVNSSEVYRELKTRAANQ